MRIAHVSLVIAMLSTAGCLQVPGYVVPGGYSSSYRRYVDHYDAHALAPAVLPAEPLPVSSTAAEVLPAPDPAAADAVEPDRAVPVPPAAAPMAYTRTSRRSRSARPRTPSFR